MNPINYLPVAIAALAFNSGSIALGGIEMMPSTVLQHKLTVGLILTEQIDNEDKETATSTIYSSKILTSKISNKSFLELFVKLGEIEDIKGWSIVGATYENDTDLQGMFLVKKGEDPVDVTVYFEIYGNEGLYIEAYKQTENNETGAYKGGYNGFETDGTFDFECEIATDTYISLYLDAIINERGTYSYNGEDEYTTVISALNFEHGVGELYDDEENVQGIVRGFYRFGKGTVSEIVIPEEIIDPQF